MKKEKDNRDWTRRDFLKASATAAAGVALVGAPTVVRGATPKKPDRLIVRAWGGAWQDALDMGVSKPFTKETGIKVIYDNTEDNEIQPKLRMAFQQKSRPPIDVNWDTTVNAMRSALGGLSVELDKKRVPNLSDLLSISKPELVEGWPLVKVYTYTYVLAYRTDVIKEPPKSWRILWEDKWKKSVGLYDDGIGFTPVAVKMAGGSIPDNMGAGWELYRKLRPNVGLLGEDESLTQNLITGQTPLQCNIIVNAIEAKRKKAPVDWTVPEEGLVVETDALWVPKNLPKDVEYWALKYVDFALSKDAQTTWCGHLGLPPMNRFSKVNPEYEKDPAFPNTEEKLKNMILTPAATQVRHQKEWFAKFAEIMK